MINSTMVAIELRKFNNFLLAYVQTHVIPVSSEKLI